MNRDLINEYFGWLKEPGSFKKTVSIAALYSLWFIALYSAWYSAFFSSGLGLGGLARHHWGWPILLGIVFLPIVNVGILGYYKRCALDLLTNDSSPLPPLGNPLLFLRLGTEVSVLLFIVFSPSMITIFLAAWSFWSFVHGDVSTSLASLLFSISLLIAALILSLVSLVIFPVCFFRQMEDSNVRWVFDLVEIWDDGLALGMPFWRIFLSLAAAGGMGASLFFLMCVLLAASPMGFFFSGVLFILICCWLISVVVISAVRSGAAFFRELPYHY